MEHLENLRAKIIEKYTDVIGLNGFVRLSDKKHPSNEDQVGILQLCVKRKQIERYAEDYLDHVEDPKIRDIYQEARDNAVHFKEAFIKLLKSLKLLK